MVTVAGRADGAIHGDLKDALGGLDHAIRALRRAIQSLRWREEANGAAAERSGHPSARPGWCWGGAGGILDGSVALSLLAPEPGPSRPPLPAGRAGSRPRPRSPRACTDADHPLAVRRPAVAGAGDLRRHPQRDGHGQRDPATHGRVRRHRPRRPVASTAFMLTMAVVIPVTGGSCSASRPAPPSRSRWPPSAPAPALGLAPVFWLLVGGASCRRPVPRSWCRC